jgi:hypothetical protein
MAIKVMGLNLGYMGGDKELLVFPHPNYNLSLPGSRGVPEAGPAI